MCPLQDFCGWLGFQPIPSMFKAMWAVFSYHFKNEYQYLFNSPQKRNKKQLIGFGDFAKVSVQRKKFI